MSTAVSPPELVRNIAAAEAAAAYAALLRADVEGRAVPPAVRAALERAVRHSGLPLDLPESARAAVIGMVESLLRQAVDLVASPEGGTGWEYTSPALLLEQGRASGMIATLFAGPAGADPDLARVLALPAPRFLDVGVGVGGLAMAAARTWPRMQVVGIDRHVPALELARQQVDEAGLSHRVALVHADIVGWGAPEPFDLVWLPGPFLDPTLVDAALRSVHEALHPGGVVVFGLYAGAGDPLSDALADLRAVRSGGGVWEDDVLCERLDTAGFTRCHAVPRRWPAPIRFVLGVRP